MPDQSEKDDYKSIPQPYIGETSEDDFKVKATGNAKIDFKALKKDHKLKFKSLVGGVSVHKEWDDDNVTMDASISVDFVKLKENANDPLSAISKGSTTFTKKF